MTHISLQGQTEFDRNLTYPLFRHEIDGFDQATQLQLQAIEIGLLFVEPFVRLVEPWSSDGLSNGSHETTLLVRNFGFPMFDLGGE